jgi:sugar lactone lactonase YvrE
VRPDASIGVSAALALATDGQLIWVLTATGQVVPIDPATNRAATGVQLGAPTDQVQGIAADRNGVWATEWVTGRLYRIDPKTLKVVATIPAGIAPKGVIATGTDVWVADTHGGIVQRIDLETNKVGVAITVGPAAPSGPNWLMSGLGSIWVGVPNSASVVRIDPVTNVIQATIAIPRSASPCGGIASAGGAVWITSCDASTNIARLDPSANTVAALVHVPGNAHAPAVIAGALWVSVATNPGTPGLIERIAPATNTVDRELSPGAGFGGGGDIVVASGSVWVVDVGHDRVLRFPLSAFPPG